MNSCARGGSVRCHTVLACNYSGPGHCGDLPGTPVPEGLDWDMWCAQTRLKPYNAKLHRGWMGCRDYSGGEMTNWGAHGSIRCSGRSAWTERVRRDLARDRRPEREGPHALPERCPPEARAPRGPHHGRRDLPRGEGHDRGAPQPVHRDSGRTRRRSSRAPEAEIWEGPGWQAKFHIGNWLDCIKSRELPVADVEVGHRSITVCHLANIAREVGRRLRWDSRKETFVGDDEANCYLDRPRRKGYELPNPV